MYGEICTLSCSVYVKSRLIKKGYSCHSDIQIADPERLSKDIKVSLAQANEILKESLEFTEGIKKNKGICVVCLPSAYPQVNELINGGLKTQCIYELTGLPGSGRTFFAMKAAAIWATNFQTSEVIYVDTESSVNLDLFKSLFADPLCLRQVKYMRIFTEEQLCGLISGLNELIKTENSMVIIDSISFLLKNLSMDDKNRSKSISKLGMKLLATANSRSVCIIVINNLNSNSQTILGESWGSIISKRLSFKFANSEYSVSL